MARFPFPLATATLLAVPGVALAQFVIQQRIVVRVQRAPLPVKQIRWVEKKGPKCIQLNTLAGALIVEPDAVDLVQEGGERVRARLDDDCPALDFYAGFYLKPTRDGRICAERDAVRSRSGRQCDIARFRKLVAKR